MSIDPRRSIECAVVFVTAALFTLLIARLQNWPFAFYELVLVVVQGITAPR